MSVSGDPRFDVEAFLFHLIWWLGGAKRPRRTRSQRSADYQQRSRVIAFWVAQCEREPVAETERASA